MKITIEYRIIRSANLIAPRNNVRTYLNGIRLDKDTNQVVATDGHRLYVADVDLSELQLEQSITIPRLLTKGLKKATQVQIQKENETEYRVTFYNRNGKSLNVQLVTPIAFEFTQPSGEVVQNFYPDHTNAVPTKPDTPLEASSFLPHYLSDIKEMPQREMG